MIRKIFKKGESFDDYSQKDISLMMSHINSYSRKKSNNNKPIKIFNFLYGENTSSYFEIFEIDANDITLSKDKLISFRKNKLQIDLVKSSY